MLFRRNPRLFEEQKKEVWKLKNLPIAPVKQKKSILSKILYPVIMLIAYILMFAFNQTSPLMLMFPAIMIVPALLIPWLDERSTWKESMNKYNEEIREYNEYLDNLNEELANRKETFILWNKLNFPEEKAEIERCLTNNDTLWNKRAEYADFMTLCLGLYNADFPIYIDIDYEQMSKCKDSSIKARVKSLISKFKYIENSPLLLNMKFHSCLGINCIKEDFLIGDIVAGILLSAIYSYGYDEMKIMVIANEEKGIAYSEGKYQWIRWLPHCWNENKTIRFFAYSSQDKEFLFSYLQKICEQRVKDNSNIIPHILVLVEDIGAFEKHPIKEYFVESNNKLNISFVFLSDKNGLPSQCESVLTVKNENEVVFENSSLFGLESIKAKPRIVETYSIEMLARYLSDIQLTDDCYKSELPKMVTFFDLYSETTFSKSYIQKNWCSNLCYIDGIKALLGLKSPIEKMEIDMSDERDGAHMLVAGTTGSGKSEFLQTFVLSLSVRYSPEEVSFVFIDFKEGGMSEAFSDLPHNAGSLTNIDSEISYFAKRAIIMLNNERKRRAKLLEPFGQKINNYHKAYHESNNGKHGSNLMQSLPHLFIVIDEFAEVISQCIEFKEMIVSLSRVGRSLGIHLVLATQSPSQSVDSQIWSNSNCKICLKVLNDDESNAVIKKNLAAKIQTRGRAYCLIGSTNRLTEFQTAWSGADTVNELDLPQVSLISAINKRTILTKNEKREYTMVTQLSALIDNFSNVYDSSNLMKPHKVLVKSLPNEYALSHKNPRLEAIIGVGDFVNEHIQKEIIFKFDGNNNNLLISGSNNSGRSNVIYGIIKQLEFSSSADDIQFFVLQYGSKSLNRLKESVLVSEYVSNITAKVEVSDEKFGRLFFYLKELIHFRRLENSSFALPHLVIVIDGWDQISSAYEQYSADLLSVFSMNPAQLNIHFILTTGTEPFNYKLKPYFDSNLILKCDSKSFGIEGISYEGAVLKKKGRGLYFDTDMIEAIEVQTIDEINITDVKRISNEKMSRLKIPTFESCFAEKGRIDRELHISSNGKSILLGLSYKTLDWLYLSFEYQGVAISYCDEPLKNKLMKYVIDRFHANGHKVYLVVDENLSKEFVGERQCDVSPEALLDFVNSINDNSVVVLDYPKITYDDRTDYNNIKMFEWQKVLANKIMSGHVLVLWFEHTSRARNDSQFSDVITKNQKRIAIGGKGERHPFFGERLDASGIYIDKQSALISLDNSECSLIKLVCTI